MTAKQKLLAAVAAAPDDATFERNLVGNLQVLAPDGTVHGYIDLRQLAYVAFADWGEERWVAPTSDRWYKPDELILCAKCQSPEVMTDKLRALCLACGHTFQLEE